MSMLKVKVTDRSVVTGTGDLMTFICSPKGPKCAPMRARSPEEADVVMDVPRGTTRTMLKNIGKLCDRCGIPKRTRRHEDRRV